MPVGDLTKLIAISGIFKKDDELDILPPPPPFPDIGMEETKIKESEKDIKKASKKNNREVELKSKKEQEGKRKAENELRKARLREKKEGEKKKLEGRRRNKKLKKQAKKKIYGFMHSIGIVKTKKEKLEIEKRKERERRKREKEQKKAEDEPIKRKKGEEQERLRLHVKREKEIEKERLKAEKEKKIEKEQEQIGRKKYKDYLRNKEKERKKRERYQKKQEVISKKVPEPITIAKKEEIRFPEIKQKKSFFGKLLGKKDEELEMELDDLEEIKSTPKMAQGIKLPDLKIHKKRKVDVKKDTSKIKLPKLIVEETQDYKREEEEEIKSAIGNMKKNIKKPPMVRGLFKKKDKPAGHNLGTPEVMPRTFDKIDNLQDIEEKMHKARMALMDFKFERAKEVYIEIMRLYSDLSSKDKYKVYNDIRDLYYERKSAEKFSKR
jgi:hypothetical protein